MADKSTYSNHAPVCPYCDHEQRDSDGAFYNEDLTELECGSCGRSFSVRVYNSWSWTCEPLNDQSR